MESEKTMNDEKLIERLRQVIGALIDSEAKERETKTVSEMCECSGEVNMVKRNNLWRFVCTSCGRLVHIRDHAERCLSLAKERWNRGK